MKRRLTLTIVAVIAVIAAGAIYVFGFQVRGTPYAVRHTPSIVSTIFPWGNLAQEIAGDKISVIVMTPPGAEPHDFEPAPRDIATVQASRLLIVNGKGMDAWAERLAPTLRPDLTSVLDLGQLTTSTDPHFWLDPKIARQAVRLIADSMSNLWPSDAQTFQANASALDRQLAELDTDFLSGLKDCRLNEIIVSHDAFEFMARRYGFTTIAVSGLSTVDEPSAKHLAELSDLIKTKGINIIFTEALASPKFSQTIADETGAKTLVLDPIEGLASGSYPVEADYFTLMRRNLSNLRTAMLCR